MKKQYVAKEEFPRTETASTDTRAHTFCREDHFGVRRTGFGFNYYKKFGSSQITALCPDATTSRKFPVQTAASNRHLSLLPPTGALQQVSIFCPRLTLSRFVRTCYTLLQKLPNSQCVKKLLNSIKTKFNFC